MNQHLKEALAKQATKQQIKALLSRQKSKAAISESSLYAAFVEPFTDVLKAANLASQDILNSSTTFLRLFLTFDPKKAEEILKKHDERRDQIAAKWKPLMEKTDAVLSTGDADIVALTLAPQFWAVSALGTQAANYGGNMVEFLDNAGLGGITKLVLPGAAALSSAADKVVDDKDDSSILDKMSVLFLGAVAAKSFLSRFKSAVDSQKEKTQNESKVLREQEEKPDFEQDWAKFLKDTGLAEKFEDDAKELFDILKDAVKEFDDDYEDRKELVEKLESADNFEAFVDALSTFGPQNESRSLKEQAQKPNFAEIKKGMEDSVKELVKSDDFINQVKEETKKESPTEEEIKKAAQKVVFLDAKKNMEEDFGGFQESFKEYTGLLSKEIEKILPSKVAMNALSKSKSPMAAEVKNFVEKAKQKYSIT